MDYSDFEQVVNTCYDPLYRFALSLSRNPEDALDLTQSTFARYAEKGRHVKELPKVKSWLFTVLYREFISRRRRDRKLVFDADPRPPDYRDNLEPFPSAKIDCAAALSALSELDETFRAPLTLFYLQDLSYREIADVLNIPIGTVMSRLARGRLSLRQALEGSHEREHAEQLSTTWRKPS